MCTEGAGARPCRAVGEGLSHKSRSLAQNGIHLGGAPGAMREPWFSESGSWLRDQPLGVKDRYWEDRSSYSNGTCPGGRD